jgi:uncharacterized protein YukE
MRVVLLVMGAVNLALVCMVAVQNNRLAESIRAVEAREPEVRMVADPPPFVRPDPQALDEQRSAAVRELRREVIAMREELTALRTAIDALDTRTGKTGDAMRSDFRTLAERLERTTAEAMEQAQKKPDQRPAGDARQLETLTAELRRLNEQFKRVIDFAAGR